MIITKEVLETLDTKRLQLYKEDFEKQISVNNNENFITLYKDLHEQLINTLQMINTILGSRLAN